MAQRIKNINRVLHGRNTAIQALDRVIFRLESRGQDSESAEKQKAKLVRRNFRDWEKANARIEASA